MVVPLVTGLAIMGLSNAERQRRYIQRLKERAGEASKAKFEARIRELEAELARERKAHEELRLAVRGRSGQRAAAAREAKRASKAGGQPVTETPKVAALKAQYARAHGDRESKMRGIPSIMRLHLQASP
jgi:hypothetical protein